MAIRVGVSILFGREADAFPYHVARVRLPRCFDRHWHCCNTVRMRDKHALANVVHSSTVHQRNKVEFGCSYFIQIHNLTILWGLKRDNFAGPAVLAVSSTHGPARNTKSIARSYEVPLTNRCARRQLKSSNTGYRKRFNWGWPRPNNDINSKINILGGSV